MSTGRRSRLEAIRSRTERGVTGTAMADRYDLMAAVNAVLEIADQWQSHADWKRTQADIIGHGDISNGLHDEANGLEAYANVVRAAITDHLGGTK